MVPWPSHSFSNCTQTSWRTASLPQSAVFRWSSSCKTLWWKSSVMIQARRISKASSISDSWQSISETPWYKGKRYEWEYSSMFRDLWGTKNCLYWNSNHTYRIPLHLHSSIKESLPRFFHRFICLFRIRFSPCITGSSFTVFVCGVEFWAKYRTEMH